MNKNLKGILRELNYLENINEIHIYIFFKNNKKKTKNFIKINYLKFCMINFFIKKKKKIKKYTNF
jgi:hypothetical protein